MRKTGFVLMAALLTSVCMAEPVCINGVCYPDEESARAAGALAWEIPGKPENPEIPENPVPLVPRTSPLETNFNIING